MTDLINDSVSIRVSVLLAARNEEENILRCLHSLDNLDFPKDQIEILIGDDDSDDATAALTQTFIEHKKHFRYIKIKKQVAGLKGKTNVLAQLAHEARGHYFLYCDADIAVAPTWATNMLAHFKEPAIGTVVGLTRMKHTHLLADLLSLEWLFALAVMRFFSFFKIPITGMGNNMAVTREAYFKIGGFEKVGFSIVEDYALFMAVATDGFGFRQAFNPKILSISEPVNTFSELLRQRKRWTAGVMESHWVTRGSLFFSTLLVPVALIAAFWYPRALNSIWHYYLLTTAISLTSVFILKQKDLLKAALLFWFYMILIGPIMLVNYYMPGKTVWKGREY